METLSPIPPLTISIQSVFFSVRVPTFQDRQWLAENFESPPRECSSHDSNPSNSTSDVIEISLVRDTHQARALLAQKHTFDEPVLCFNMHGHSGKTRASQRYPNTVYDEELCVFYQVRSYCDVSVVAKADLSGARIALLRVMREIASQILLGRMQLPFHAAAVSRDSNAILILGDRRAGKTTLLLHLLAAQKCDFISNDRMFLEPRAGQCPMALGLPGIVNIRPGSLEFAGGSGSVGGSPKYPGLWRVEPWRARMTLEECRSLPESEEHSQGDSSLSLSPRQFLHLAGKKLVSAAPAKLFLFPQITRGNSTSWRELSSQEVHSKLCQNLFPFSESRLSPSWSSGNKELLTERWQQQLEGISKSVLGVELCLEAGRPIAADALDPMLSDFC